MLSYQHGFHAGNFADVHKHMILALMLEALNVKEKPWSYLETHGGSALYDLTDEQAQKTGEFLGGISKLWDKKDLPEAFRTYIKQVQAVNQDTDDQGVKLRFYPGSPSIAAMMSRDSDHLAIMELHPAEYQRVKQHFRGQSQVAVHHRDGYEGVLSMMPPKPNRGLVLIDPSYEVKTEYQQVAKFIKQIYGRWPNASVAIWYPILRAGHHKEMIDKIAGSGIRKIYQSELFVQDSGSERMFGSGMLLINPPWQLDQKIASVIPWLYQALAQPTAAEPQGTWLVPE
ncbi:23S rRNA (adenine(2030)-N(6))-methyltransferase RlmJ [Neptunomonas antarctica]|uniref:Ribosomal RNA large subunit methyltransferase J n=1 Tax=Neptunomonas antarctica TaxID=619304 RepID=A0A1N7MFJ2_9GAMM|nr:23S rRNA (adenine(2030)-N(6))-methyltransferase RlmJ [Neptunomonas antarctica]SIS84790.1 23S rRNA (adenine2030-N6)-methyltransferase [Neptunomonas antarctica]